MSPLMGQPGPSAPPAYSDVVRQILELCRVAVQLADDDESAMVMERVTSLLQAELAAEQKEEQGALSGRLSPRLMRRAYGGGGS